MKIGLRGVMRFMQVSEINPHIRHISNVFEDILAERGLIESQLFPVSEYISVSCYHTYDHQYDLMKQVWSKTSPEELAKKSKTLLSEIHALSITYQWLYYGLGRMGIIFNRCESDASKEDGQKREEWRWLLEHWYRLATSYFESGKPTVASAEFKNVALGEDSLSWLKDNLEPVQEDQAKKVRRTLGSVDLYAFMDECEARAKIIDHGPFKLENGDYLVVSEYTHLHDGSELWLPWSDTETKLPSSTLGVAMTVRDVEFNFNDVGTMTIEPGDYSKLVASIAAYTKRGQKIVPLGLDELPSFAEAADAAQTELYMKFAEWDKKTLMIAGAEAYWRGFARYTNQVGITDKIDWKISSAVQDEYIPIFMETDSDAAFLRFGRFDDEMVEDPTLYLLPE
jgi:hypothetical protein